MQAQKVIEKQNRIVMARSLRRSLRQALAKKETPVIVVECTEHSITQFLHELPSNYEQLLSYAVSDIVLELSQLLRQDGKEACIHASIKKRRSVVIKVRF